MRERIGLLLRGLLLEAHFNPRGKQRGGWGWILGRECRVDRREPFNTNPVLAGYAIGWMRGAGKGIDPQHLGPLASALGGAGDRIVWGALRGTATAVAIALAFLGPIPAALAYLLVYNPPELALRWRALRVGLEGIAAIRADLSRAGLPRILPIAGRVGSFTAGIATGSLFAGGVAGGGGGAPWIAAAAVAGLFAATRRRSLGFQWAGGAALLLGLLWAIVGPMMGTP